jgi:cell division protein FtsB
MKIISARSFWVPVMVTTLVATFFAALLEREGHEYVKLLRAQAILEQRLARIDAQNRRLRIERTELLTDLGAVARAAREELNLEAPGENVIVAENVPPPPEPPSGPPVLGPVERLTTMPQFTYRAMLASLAGSSVLFFLWNAVATLWAWARGRAAQPVQNETRGATLDEEPDRRTAA